MTNSQGRQTQNFFLLLAGWTFRTGKLCQRPKFRKERRIKGKAWKSVFHGSILHIAKPKSLPGPHPLSPLIAMPIPQCSPPLSALSSSHYLRTIGSSPHTRGSQPPSCTPPHQPRLCFTLPASSPLSLPQLQLFLPWSLPPHHSIRPHSQGFWGVLTK